MIAEEGRVDVVGIGAGVGGVCLFQSLGISGDLAVIAGIAEDGDDLAAGTAEGEVEETGDAAGVVVRHRAEAVPDLCHQIGIFPVGCGSLLNPGQDLHVHGGVAGVELLGGI